MMLKVLTLCIECNEPSWWFSRSKVQVWKALC